MRIKAPESPLSGARFVIVPKCDSWRTQLSPNAAATKSKVPSQYPPGITGKHLTATIGPVDVAGLPITAVSAAGSGLKSTVTKSPVFPNFPRVSVPLLSQRTIFATIPSPYRLRSQDNNDVASSSACKNAPSIVLKAGSKPNHSTGREMKDVRSSRSRSRLTITQGSQSLSTSSYATNGSQTLNIIWPPSPSFQTSQPQPPSLKSSAQTSTLHLHTPAITKKRSTSVSPATLLRCMVLMMSLAESPGAVPLDTAEFDLAVCASLYGVRLSKGSVLTYDKQDGFYLKKMVKKAKKGKKKKKKRQGTGKKK